jgi:diguanylate cyclase (GGDEF)-like protein
MELVEVYRSDRTVLAQLVRTALEKNGLHPILVGENLAATVGMGGFLAPCRVLVPNLEEPDARVVIEMMNEADDTIEVPETCPTCEAPWEKGFEECWQCQAPLQRPAPEGGAESGEASDTEASYSAPIQIHLLKGAEPSALAALERCPVRALTDGECLISPGPHNGLMYIVLRGQLTVHLETVDEPSVARIREGEIAGELSLLDGSERSAFAVADGAVELLEVDQKTLDALLLRFPKVSGNMLRMMASRLRGGNDFVISSRQLQAEYRRRASVDALTGLHNRGWLDDLLPRQVQRSMREEQPLSVAMLDVDHFKRFNDTYGHQAGDFVLFAVGRVLQASVRPTDLIARYGGEEFTVIMPNTGLDGARIAAERIRTTLESTALMMPDDTALPTVTMSLGVAMTVDGDSAPELISRADAALYEAKRAGRNRVHLATG